MVRHPRCVFVNYIGCNYSLTQHLVARYVYIYYVESNNNYIYIYTVKIVTVAHSIYNKIRK